MDIALVETEKPPYARNLDEAETKDLGGYDRGLSKTAKSRFLQPQQQFATMWASMKSFQRKDGEDRPPGPGRKGERGFHKEKMNTCCAPRSPPVDAPFDGTSPVCRN